MGLIKKEKSQTLSGSRLAHQTKTRKCLQKNNDVQNERKEKQVKSVPSFIVKKPLRKRKNLTYFGVSKEQVSELLDFVVHKLDEGKAQEIVTINLINKTSFTDYLVIATGTSSRHVMGLMNNLVKDLKKAGYRVHVSGDSGDGNWVVIDLIDVVVHLFTADARSFYNLEDMWM